MISRICQFVLVATFLAPRIAIANETWTCKTDLGEGKFHQDEYLIAEDRLIPKKGSIAYKIFENNNDHILAYFVHWNRDEKTPKPMFDYFLIDKHSGRLSNWNDINIVVFQNQFQMDLNLSIGTCAQSK